MKYLHNEFSDVYKSTVLSVIKGRRTIRNQVYQLEVVDTAGDIE